ncbi:MAG: hypothetical protein K6C13_15555 [Oscillospiraceae bacterium]|nr:hypothetical protein [Oscillospiraceae bacterium]
MEQKIPFEVFKSNVCHEVKNKGEITFMINLLKSDIITIYFNKQWYDESLYLLAMLDYLSRKNNIPICTNYNHFRNYKLAEVIYPEGVLLTSKILNKPELLQESYDNAIPEFKRFNIVENEVENVV